MFKRTDKLAWSKMQRPSYDNLEIKPFRNGWQVYEGIWRSAFLALIIALIAVLTEHWPDGY
jgi:hypothetical protein